MTNTQTIVVVLDGSFHQHSKTSVGKANCGLNFPQKQGKINQTTLHPNDPCMGCQGQKWSRYLIGKIM